jgi:FtsH-binding integral membrane protein
MHQAPALAFQVGRSRIHGYLLIALASLGVLTGISWLNPLDAAGWRQALFFITFLIALAIAVRQWLRWPMAWPSVAWGMAVQRPAPLKVQP